MAETAEKTQDQARLINTMKKRGGKGFRVLRSAETGLRTYKQPGKVSAARRSHRAATLKG